MRFKKFTFIFALIIIASCQNTHLNELARLEYESTGCFGGERSVLSIYASGEDTLAVLTTKVQSGTKSITAKMNIDDLGVINRFIEELKYLKEETGCTSVDSYKLTTSEIEIYKVDGGCEWNGYDRLRIKLFKQ